ncbi:hypothetical protein [Flavivirga sp. 57AJ16]|uniref:hypothetical protein n=1 Tax=Flavivirga sp. 57AJ16 TaxID=3025307 RepID=UPI002366695F|nr:hypothetical protein [Flavivirga sp. 57AJ16]MDD7886470.1 hypothetical protein [Flavivirga sp. 57AJ16]
MSKDKTFIKALSSKRGLIKQPIPKIKIQILIERKKIQKLHEKVIIKNPKNHQKKICISSIKVLFFYDFYRSSIRRFFY